MMINRMHKIVQLSKVRREQFVQAKKKRGELLEKTKRSHFMYHIVRRQYGTSSTPPQPNNNNWILIAMGLIVAYVVNHS